MKYSMLDDSHTTVYVDEYDREEILGRPKYGLFHVIGLVFVYLFWLITLPFSWCCSFKIIRQYERAIIFRLGRVQPLKGPGLIFVIPFVDRLKRVDMRMRAFKVPPQEIVTIDRGLLKIGADVQYRIVDPLAVHTLIQDINHSLRVSAQAALNNNLCYEKINYILSEKQYLQTRLQTQMSKMVSEWGIEIARFELTHSTILKGSGGSDPTSNNDEHGGHAAIIELIKNFTSNSSSTFNMPGMLPGNFTSGMSPANLFASPKTSTKQTPPDLLTPDELFCIIKGIINEDLCLKISAIYEFNVSNETGTKIWTVDLKNIPGYVRDGPHNGIVDVKFTLGTNDFQDIFYGKLSPTDAYMCGKLEVDGSLQTATKLEHLVAKMKGQ